MAEYRVTFGQRHAREPHPWFFQAHPDGWVAIDAPDFASARVKAIQELGLMWAGICECGEQGEWEGWDQLFPRGELARWEAT